MLYATLAQQGPQHAENVELRTLIDELKAKTDLRKFLGPVLKNSRDFGDYVQATCVAPDHHDTKASLLVYPDQCRCQACSFKADILDLYRQQHPDAKITDAIEALLADPSLTFTGEVKTRELRGLSQDISTRNHLSLVEHPEVLVGLEGMGFTREAIQHFQLGVAEVLVRLNLDEQELAEAAPRIEWRDTDQGLIPYQWQRRYSVPVTKEGRLVQILYRKADPNDLGAKITTEKGAGVHLFNADALRGADMAVYAEGWGDVIAFWQAGIAAVTSTSGAGHFNPEWTDQLGHIKRLYVVGDADAAGQKMMARFKERIPWARPLELPFEHGSKGDIRDLWLAGWRRKEFVALLKQADLKSNWATLRRGR